MLTGLFKFLVRHPVAIGLFAAVSLAGCHRGETHADSDASLEPAELKWTVENNGNNFGEKVIGSTVVRIFKVTNYGQRSTASLRFSLDAPFELEATNCPAALAANVSCEVKVRFLASSVGQVTGNLSARYSANETQKSTSLSLQATALGYPKLRMAVSGFADTLVGGRSIRTMTIVNEGGSDAGDVRFSALSGPFSISRIGCGAVLRASESCTVDLAFAPFLSGISTADIAVAYQSGGLKRVASARLDGKAMLPAKLEFAANQMFTLPDAYANATSSQFGIQIRNTGEFPATGVAITVPPPLLIASNGCGATIAVGGVCNLLLIFTPTVAGTINPIFSAKYFNGVIPSELAQPLMATGVNPPLPGTATITTPIENQVVQRGTTTETLVSFQGVVTGNADRVQARVSVGGTPGDWVTIFSGNSSDRAYSGTLSLPAGGWYTLQVRVMNYEREGIPSAPRTFGVGDVYLVAGSTDSTNNGVSKHTAPSGRVVVLDSNNEYVPASDPNTYCGDGSTGGSLWTALGERLVASRNIPIAFVCVGWKATAIAAWLPASNSSPTRKGFLFDRLKTTVQNLGRIRAILWVHGDQDTYLGTSTGNYVRGVRQLIQAINASVAFEVRWGIGVSAERDMNTCDDSSEPLVCAGTHPVRRGAIQTATALVQALPTAFAGANTDDLLGTTMRDEQFMFTDEWLNQASERWFNKLEPAF